MPGVLLGLVAVSYTQGVISRAVSSGSWSWYINPAPDNHFLLVQTAVCACRAASGLGGNSSNPAVGFGLYLPPVYNTSPTSKTITTQQSFHYRSRPLCGLIGIPGRH